ncbi:MAG: metal-dependent hydrolase [Actinomycetota bacterium]
MPLPIAHGFLGASIVAAIHPKPTDRFYFPLLIGAFLANAADFDFAFSIIFGLKGWHRGFTHSIFFALIFTLILLISFGRNYFREALAYGLAFTSHCFLDFVTTKEGDGLELLFPFLTDRFGLRWFGLSEIPSRFSTFEILNTIGLELLIFAPVFMFVFWLRTFVKKKEAQ